MMRALQDHDVLSVADSRRHSSTGDVDGACDGLVLVERC